MRNPVRHPEPETNVTEHAMSHDSSSTTRPARPSYPQLSGARKAAMAVVAVLVSSTLLGGMLSMFEMRSGDSAAVQASMQPAPSSDGFAARQTSSAPRG